MPSQRRQLGNVETRLCSCCKSRIHMVMVTSRDVTGKNLESTTQNAKISVLRGDINQVYAVVEVLER